MCILLLLYTLLHSDTPHTLCVCVCVYTAVVTMIISLVGFRCCRFTSAAVQRVKYNN